MQTKLGRGDDFVLADYFDMIGGTSMGSMIATELALGARVADIRKRFERTAPRIFRKPMWWRGERPRFGILRPRFDAERRCGRDTTPWWRCRFTPGETNARRSERGPSDDLTVTVDQHGIVEAELGDAVSSLLASQSSLFRPAGSLFGPRGILSRTALFPGLCAATECRIPRIFPESRQSTPETGSPVTASTASAQGPFWTSLCRRAGAGVLQTLHRYRRRFASKYRADTQSWRTVKQAVWHHPRTGLVRKRHTRCARAAVLAVVLRMFNRFASNSLAVTAPKGLTATGDQTADQGGALGLR